MTEEADTLEMWSQRFGLPIWRNLKDFSLIKQRVPLVSYAFVKKRKILPLAEEEGKVQVALLDPLDLEAIQEIRQALGRETLEGLCFRAEMEEAIEYAYHQEHSAASLLDSKKEEKNQEIENEEYDLLDHKADSPIIRTLNAILQEAIQQGASDIHFEPGESGMEIRYRIDGVLHKRHSPPKDYQIPLITRIKVLSCLDIAEQRLPQDGRMKLRMGSRSIDFRVSSVPCVFGERIVLRILDKSNVLLGIHKLGLHSDVLCLLQSWISHPEGIVLVTGPTGSGKTTTLYSILMQLQEEHTNIMTIEDPVEYKMAGIGQIGVNTKIQLTFAAGLRHILRQDPDVIMVGEVRDRETAEIAIQASLTGHLVFTTLHTNDAPSAVTRLVDMGIEPYLLTSSVIGVIAQRLVRTLCPHCKESYVPSPQEYKDLGLVPEEGMFFRGRGCEWCAFSGYKGRRGIYELMTMDSTMKKQVLYSPDAHMLHSMAVQQGMSTLRKEGAFCVLQGLTTTQEVLRVTRALQQDKS